MKIIQKAKRLFRVQKLSDAEELLEKYQAKNIDLNGKLIPDPTPLAPPVGYNPQPSMVEIVRDMVRSERLKQDLDDQGLETFEESEDFDIEDDPVAQSPWENEFDPPIEELVAAGREAIAKRKKDRDPPPAANERPKPKEGEAQTPSPKETPQEADDAS